MFCVECSKPLTGSQKKFCSRICTNKCGNNRNQNYAAQQARGLKRKLKAVEDKGGGCARCGYKENLAALTFHHRSNKSFGLDMRKMSNASQKRIDQELAKCDLLCIRCHTEHHHPELRMDLL